MTGSLRAICGSVALGMFLAITGCATIPTAGPIEDGEPVQAELDEPIIRQIPRPPDPGLSPDDLVSRFLAASASFEGDHEVARQYLTPEAADVWDPAAGVSVFDAERTLTLDQKGRVVNVGGRQVGFITADGALTPVVPKERFVDQFTVERVGQEWRIAKLPSGLLLSGTDVDSLFRSYSLYFLAPGSDRLVPDPVFVPVGQQGLATSLVRSLLDGPTRWLEPAVETAVPPDTSLQVDSVPVENNIAQVDLSTDVLDADEATLRRFSAQLVWTLMELPDVQGVRITTNGAPLQVGAEPPQQDRQTWELFDPNRLPDAAAAVLIRRGAVHRIVDDRAVAAPGPFGRGRLDLREPATSPDGLLMAALSDDGQQVYLNQGMTNPNVEVIAKGTDFSRPSFTADGSVWLVDRFGSDEQRSTIWRKPIDGEPLQVRAPELRDRRVQQLRLSLDGTRVAVVVQAPSGDGKLFLGRVVRTANGVSVQALRPLGDSIDDIRDVTWQNASSLVVLGRDRGTVLQPFEVGVNSVVDQVVGTTPEGMTSVTAAPGFNLLASRRGFSDIWQNDVDWSVYLRGSDPAYPG